MRLGGTGGTLRRMIRSLVAQASFVLALGLAPVASATPLEELLAKAGSVEKARTDTTCKLTEDLQVEQFDGDGVKTGTLFRKTVITQVGPEQIDRKELSERIEGEVSDRIRERPKPKGERKDRLGAFHPDTQANYDFELLEPGPAGARVRFAPKKANEQRMKGIATIDPASGRILRLDITPSDKSIVLKALDVVVEFVDTPCGNFAKSITAEGKVSLVVYKVGFRSTSKLSGHERVSGP